MDITSEAALEDEAVDPRRIAVTLALVPVEVVSPCECVLAEPADESLIIVLPHGPLLLASLAMTPCEPHGWPLPLPPVALAARHCCVSTPISIMVILFL